jgi:hypothetical protein
MPQSIARRPDYPLPRLTVAALLVIAATVVALARGLPTHTFYAGDPGVKMIATRHVVAHPSQPLEIPLPQIAGAPAPFVDPFFIVHGEHSHAVAPELFPLLSAPFLALFGQAGLYVLPAVGLLLALAATVWLAVLLDARRNPIANILTAFLGTPLIFYGECSVQGACSAWPPCCARKRSGLRWRCWPARRFCDRGRAWAPSP